MNWMKVMVTMTSIAIAAFVPVSSNPNIHNLSNCAARPGLTDG
jgi:hypothetical protein